MELRTEYLTTKEVADLLKCTSACLVKYRHERTGPPFLRVGRLIRYKLPDLTTWLEGNRVMPESAEKACRI